jgi:hypothetical protein
MKSPLSIDWLVTELKKQYDIDLTLNPLVAEAREMQKIDLQQAACHDPFLGDLPAHVGRAYCEDKFKDWNVE